MKMTRLLARVRAPFVVLLAFGSFVLVSEPASLAGATSPDLELHVPGDPAGWAVSPTVPVLNGSNLGAGQSATGSIGIRNTGTDGGTLTLKAAEVSGTLAQQLRLSLQSADGDISWSGSVADLENGILISHSFMGGATMEAVLTAGLPSDLGNPWEDGTASFRLVWTLTGAGTSSQASVGAVQAAGTSPAHRAESALAFTGAMVGPSFILAAVALILGLILTVTERQGRRRRPSGQ